LRLSFIGIGAMTFKTFIRKNGTDMKVEADSIRQGIAVVSIKTGTDSN